MTWVIGDRHPLSHVVGQQANVAEGSIKMAKAIKGVIGAVTSIFKGPKAPPPPEKVKVAPLPDDEVSRRAHAKRISRERGGKGRAATMLTNEDTLG